MVVLIGFLFVALSFTGAVARAAPLSIEESIYRKAFLDGIDLSVLDVTPAALAEIAATYTAANFDYHQVDLRDNQKSYATMGIGNIFDVHAHAEPDWFRNMVPFTGNNPSPSTGGGSPNPQWNLTDHINFMNTMGITHSVLGFTTPAANAYLGDRKRTIAIARLINEQLVAYARTQSDKFSFFATVPLPYVDDAIEETKYALELGAVGVALLSNHEGMYLGNPAFVDFWRYLDGVGSRQIVYVHPSTPYLKVHDEWVIANPNPVIDTSRMEFYMETARTFMDLTVSQTLHNFTHTHFVLPHVGGAFPSMIDRVLKTTHPELYDASLEIFRTRFWWDSASPTYYHQVTGLLGYDIPPANLLFGSDYPFVSTAANQNGLQAILAYPNLTDKEKGNILSNNYKSLFVDKLEF